MRLLYLGTPAFSAEFLHALLEDPFFDVVGLVCQPDEPVGRKKILTPPPTKQCFQEKYPDRPIFQPTKLKDPTLAEALTSLNIDASVIVAYGRIIPQALLTIPKLGNVNVHPSLLPRWRGPSPLQAALAQGDTETGVSIMLIDEQMDHGPILAQTRFSLRSDETLETLTRRVVHIGTPLLVTELKKLVAGTSTPREQEHAQATYCKLLKKEDGIITAQDTAESIERKIRAYTPWPGVRAIFVLTNGETQEVKLHAVRHAQKDIFPGTLASENGKLFMGTAKGTLEVLSLQPATKNILSASEYTHGYQPTHLLFRA